MLDAAGPAPDLALLLSPGDRAEFVAIADWATRRDRRERCWLYVVLHGRHGPWTHAYRVVPDHRPGHLTIHLERALEGDCRDALKAWLLGHPRRLDQAV